MATIKDLPNKDIAEMTDEELRAHILAMRGRRRNPDPELKAQSIKKAIQKKNNTTALKSVPSMLKGMTPEQASQLLTALRKQG